MKIISKLFLLVFLLGMAACGGDGGDNVARVRVLQASADTGTVDVYLDDILTFQDVAFSEATPYEFTSSGSTTFDFNLAGSPTRLVSETAGLDQDGDYTVLMTGFAGDLDGVTYRDDNSFPEPGNAKLRVIHSAPSAPNVDVYVTFPGADIAGMSPSISDLSFKEASNYLQVPTDDYEVIVTAKGSKVPLLDEFVTLNSGEVRTGVALDAVGGGEPFGLLVLNDVN